jgi:hypothetical protein
MWHRHAKGRSKIAFQPIFSIQTLTFGLNTGGRIGGRREGYAQL